MGNIEQQFLRGIPPIALRRSTYGLIYIDEQLSVEAWFLWRNRVVSLCDNVSCSGDVHYGPMDFIRPRIVHKMHDNLMPSRIADTRP